MTDRTQLAVPLGPEQIAAAQAIYQRMPLWGAIDEGLRDLARKMPGFDRATVLVNVAAVNELYGAQVRDVMRMAEHVHEILDTRASSGFRPEIVEQIAALQHGVSGKLIRHRSFASKFAHFFIDARKFPIMDEHARRIVAKHLGTRASSLADYVMFEKEHRQLKTLPELTCSNAELDRYLWLAGQIEKARRLKKPVTNSELKELLDSHDPVIDRLVAVLLGTCEM